MRDEDDLMEWCQRNPADAAASIMGLTAQVERLTERAERAEAKLAQVRAKVPVGIDLTDDDDRWVADEAYRLLVDLDDILDQ